MNVFGPYGTAANQVYYPGDVAVGPSGNVYVADTYNNRVQVFSSSGTYMSSWGGTAYGSAYNQFSSPQGIAVGPAGQVYVADSSNSRVQIYGADGSYQSTLGTTGSSGTLTTQLNAPYGVAVSSGGTVYVADTFNHRVEVFNSSNGYQSTWGTSGTFGSSNTQFKDPYRDAVGPNGTVYVADTANHRVQMFSASGAYQGTLGTTGVSGSGTTQFSNPQGIAVSATGVIYVADSGNQRIQIFNSAGTYQGTLGTSGSYGSAYNQFDNPGGLSIGNNGMLYVADTTNSRLVRYFDPNSWVSGVNNFTDAASGPTSLGLSSALTLNSTMGLNVGNTLTQSGGAITLAGGSISAPVFTLNSGTFNYQYGTHALTTTTLGGGSFTVLTGAPYTVNSGESLLDTYGTIASPALNISGFLSNQYGLGSITSALININSGGVYSAPFGFTVISGQSLALLGGSVLNGSTVTNNGVISGNGVFSSAVSNASGGKIQMVGNSSINFEGGLFNSGQLQIATGSDANVIGALTNLSGSKVTVAGNSQATFFNNVTNNPGSQFQVSAGSTAVFFGNVTGLSSITGSGTTDFEGGTTPQALSATGTAIVGSALAATSIKDNTLMVNSAATINAKSTANDPSGTSVVNTLSFSNGGKLDLTNNSLVIDYTGPVGTLVNDTRTELLSGQLTSSSATASARLGYGDNAALGKATFAGQSVDSTSILVKYTFAGDVNLDGKVDITDLTLLANSFGKAGVWTSGDFDYNGTVDISDLTLLATNFGAGATTPLTMDFNQALSLVAEQTGSSVPEPCIASAGLMLAGLMRKRRFQLRRK